MASDDSRRIPPPAGEGLTRRCFLRWSAGAAAGLAAAGVWADPPATEPVVGKPAGSKVVIARDDRLLDGSEGVNQATAVKLLNESVIRLTGQTDAKAAWRTLFKPDDVVGLKVNCLGRTTRPEVAHAIVGCLVAAGISAGRIIIWDRFDRELVAAKYRLNRGGGEPRCYGTDSLGSGMAAGYEGQVQKSGGIGSLYSRIVASQCTALVSVPVLKDHSLAGLSGAMKNFYGAIHNPNKYHEDNCDPFVADVVAHPYIRDKLRLVVFDATTAQYHGGPPLRPQWSWPFSGLLVAKDPVAADRLAADLIDEKRKAEKTKSLADDGRPTKYIASAERLRLGVADPARIERIEL